MSPQFLPPGIATFHATVPGVDRHQAGAENVMDMLFTATGIRTPGTCAPLRWIMRHDEWGNFLRSVRMLSGVTGALNL
jgi:hypothetical protein